MGSFGVVQGGLTKSHILQVIASPLGYPELQDPVTEDITYLSQRTWGYKGDTNFGASYLLVSFHSSGRGCVHCLSEK